MPINIECPKCGKAYRVPDERAGQMKRCLACKTSFLIPEVLPLPQSTPPRVSMPSAPAITETVRTFGDLKDPPVDSAFPATTEHSWSPPQPNREAEDAVAVEWKMGDVILDLYEVMGILGEGGMGKVYKVLHRGWNLELAVKSPKPEIFARSGGKERFVQEAETWVNLGMHPHIVSCFYVRTLGGVPRIFAEYVEGGSLAEWIDSRRLYQGGPEKALARILDVAIQFAWGLQYAHEKGVIHQDVKPGNVLLTPDGTAKVSDFGLAKARSESEKGREEQAAEILELKGKLTADQLRTLRATWGGMTPAFCSPEQARREKLTRRTDLWSWAVSVLEMFIGEVTWLGGQAAAEALEGYLDIGVGDSRLPRMPDALADLLKHCFARDPDARPHDLRQAADLVRQIWPKPDGAEYVRVEPKSTGLLANSLNNRAVSLLDMGKDADPLFADAIRADPHCVEAVYNQELAHWRAGRSTGEAVVNRLLDLEQESGKPWRSAYGRAWVHIEQLNEPAAREALLQVKARSTNDPEASVALEEATHALRSATPGQRAPYLIARPRAASDALTDDLRFKGLVDAATSALRSARFPAAVELLREARDMSGYGNQALGQWREAQRYCTRGALRGARAFGHFTGSPGAVCALTANGHFLISGGYDAKIQVWDVALAECKRTWAGHAAQICSIAMTPDARVVISAAGGHPTKRDLTMRVWDVRESRCMGTLEGHEGQGPIGVAVTPDGTIAISVGTDETLRVWDTAHRRCIRTVQTPESGRHVSITADGRMAVLGMRKGPIWMVDLEHGKRLHVVEEGLDPGWITALAMTPDGRTAVSANQDRTIRVWDLQSGKCVKRFEGHGEGVVGVNALSIAADGRHAASVGDDKALRIWDLRNGRSIARMDKHYEMGLGDVALTPDAQFVAAAAITGELDVECMDWDLVAHEVADWDDAARPWLSLFLSCQTPLRGDAMTREGRACWTDKDVEGLMDSLAWVGLGWLRKDGVRHELEKMAAAWEGPPPLTSHASEGYEVASERLASTEREGPKKGSLDPRLLYNMELDRRSSAEKLRGRVNEKMKNGDFGGAIEDAEEWTRVCPEDGAAFELLGFLWGMTHQPQRAILALSRALELGVDDSGTWGARGESLTEVGEFRRAIADFDRALKIDPSFTPALVSRGSAHLQNGDIESAVSDWRRAIDLDPAYRERLEPRIYKALSRQRASPPRIARPIPRAAKAQLDQAWSRMEKRDLEGALTFANEAIHCVPDCSEALSLRAFIASFRGDTRSADVDMNKALQLDPDDALARSLRALTRAEQGDPDGSIEDCERAFETAPSDWVMLRFVVSIFARTIVGRGCRRALKGDYAGAITDFTRLLEIDPGNLEALFHRGLTYKDRDNYDLARTDLTNALTHAPDNWEHRQEVIGMLEELSKRPSADTHSGRKLGRPGLVSSVAGSSAPKPDLDVRIEDLDHLELSRELIETISPPMAKTYRVVPLRFKDGVLTVATCESTAQGALEDLKFILRCEVDGVQGTTDAVDRAIKKYYGSSE